MASQEEDNKLECISNVNKDQESYFLEVYKKHESILNNKNEPFENKVDSLIDIWKTVGELNLPEFDIRHVIQIMDWAKLHALNIVLTAEWNGFKDTHQSKLIDEIEKAQAQLLKLNDGFATRCKKLADVVKNPWEDPVLMKLMKTKEAEIGPEEIEFFCVETAYLVSVRLKKLCESHCEDLALNLVTAFMNCKKLAKDQNFNLNLSETQMWFIFDIYIALLYKFQEKQKIVVLLKELSFEEGLQLIKRFAKKRIKISKIWKNCQRVAVLALQMYISQAVVKYTEDLKDILKNYLEIYLSLCNTDNLLQDFATSIRRISNLADASGLYLFCDVVEKMAGSKLKPFVIEMYIRALTSDMNELERQKDAKEDDKAERTTSRLAAAFCNLAVFLKEHVNVARECVLTAFSLEPTKERLKSIEEYARQSGFNVLDTGQEWKCKLHPPVLPSDEITWICSECGDWMCKPQLNLPKINMTLNEALQTSVLGISEALCDDLVVCLSNPRYQILSWFLPWDDLQRLCIMYLQDPQTTKNFVTELKFVDIDYSIFKGIKKEPVDELAGIERGYEQYLDHDFVSGEESSSDSEDSMSQDSRPYSLGSDGAGESFYIPLIPTQQKSDPNTLKSLRMFRHNLKRKDKEPGEGIPEKISKQEPSSTITSSAYHGLPETTSLSRFLNGVPLGPSQSMLPPQQNVNSKNVKTATLPLLGGQVAKNEIKSIQVHPQKLNTPKLLGNTRKPKDPALKPYNQSTNNNISDILKKELTVRIPNKLLQNGSKENSHNTTNSTNNKTQISSQYQDIKTYTRTPQKNSKDSKVSPTPPESNSASAHQRAISDNQNSLPVPCNVFQEKTPPVQVSTVSEQLEQSAPTTKAEPLPIQQTSPPVLNSCQRTQPVDIKYQKNYSKPQETIPSQCNSSNQEPVPPPPQAMEKIQCTNQTQTSPIKQDNSNSPRSSTPEKLPPPPQAMEKIQCSNQTQTSPIKQDSSNSLRSSTPEKFPPPPQAMEKIQCTNQTQTSPIKQDNLNSPRRSTPEKQMKFLTIDLTHSPTPERQSPGKINLTTSTEPKEKEPVIVDLTLHSSESMELIEKYQTLEELEIALKPVVKNSTMPARTLAIALLRAKQYQEKQEMAERLLRRIGCYFPESPKKEIKREFPIEPPSRSNIKNKSPEFKSQQADQQKKLQPPSKKVKTVDKAVNTCQELYQVQKRYLEKTKAIRALRQKEMQNSFQNQDPVKDLSLNGEEKQSTICSPILDQQQSEINPDPQFSKCYPKRDQNQLQLTTKEQPLPTGILKSNQQSLAVASNKQLETVEIAQKHHTQEAMTQQNGPPKTCQFNQDLKPSTQLQISQKIVELEQKEQKSPEKPSTNFSLSSPKSTVQMKPRVLTSSSLNPETDQVMNVEQVKTGYHQTSTQKGKSLNQSCSNNKEEFSTSVSPHIPNQNNASKVAPQNKEINQQQLDESSTCPESTYHKKITNPMRNRTTHSITSIQNQQPNKLQTCTQPLDKTKEELREQDPNIQSISRDKIQKFQESNSLNPVPSSSKSSPNNQRLSPTPPSLDQITNPQHSPSSQFPESKQKNQSLDQEKSKQAHNSTLVEGLLNQDSVTINLNSSGQQSDKPQCNSNHQLCQSKGEPNSLLSVINQPPITESRKENSTTIDTTSPTPKSPSSSLKVSPKEDQGVTKPDQQRITSPNRNQLQNDSCSSPKVANLCRSLESQLFLQQLLQELGNPASLFENTPKKRSWVVKHTTSQTSSEQQSHPSKGVHQKSVRTNLGTASQECQSKQFPRPIKQEPSPTLQKTQIEPHLQSVRTNLDTKCQIKRFPRPMKYDPFTALQKKRQRKQFPRPIIQEPSLVLQKTQVEPQVQSVQTNLDTASEKCQSKQFPRPIKQEPSPTLQKAQIETHPQSVRTNLATASEKCLTKQFPRPIKQEPSPTLQKAQIEPHPQSVRTNLDTASEKCLTKQFPRPIKKEPSPILQKAQIEPHVQSVRTNLDTASEKCQSKEFPSPINQEPPPTLQKAQIEPHVQSVRTNLDTASEKCQSKEFPSPINQEPSPTLQKAQIEPHVQSVRSNLDTASEKCQSKEFPSPINQEPSPTLQKTQMESNLPNVSLNKLQLPELKVVLRQNNPISISSSSLQQQDLQKKTSCSSLEIPNETNNNRENCPASEKNLTNQKDNAEDDLVDILGDEANHWKGCVEEIDNGLFSDVPDLDEVRVPLNNNDYSGMEKCEELKDVPEELPKNSNLTENIRTYAKKLNKVEKDCIKQSFTNEEFDKCNYVNSSSNILPHSNVESTKSKGKELKVVLCRLYNSKNLKEGLAANKDECSTRQKCERGKNSPKSLRRRKSIDKSENKSGKISNVVQNHRLSPLQDINPRVTPKNFPNSCCDLNKSNCLPDKLEKQSPKMDISCENKNYARSVLANVPGLNDFEMIRPSNVDQIVNVVQVSGGRVIQNVPIQNTQTSTQITPHIQRIGQPRISDSKTEHSATTTTNTTSTAVSTVVTTTKTATSQPSTLINILSQQVIRPVTTQTNVRMPPMINILSQQIIRPVQVPKTTANTVISTESNQTKPVTTTAEQSVLTPVTIVTKTTTTVKTVNTVTSGHGGTILQFICKSSLPKFQQAFGKAVYQNNTDTVDSTTSNVETGSTTTEPKKTTVTKAVPVNVQPLQGSVIYSRQVPVGQTISLIPPGGTTRQVFRIATSNPEQLLVKDSVIHSKMSALLAAALQSRAKTAEGEVQINCDEATKVTLTRPTFVQNARIVKPVQLQLPTNMVRTQPPANLSSTTLEQLREFDMVYKQIKERSSTSTPADNASNSPEAQEGTPQRISVTYVNQLPKYTQLSPVVVVTSYSSLPPAVSPALSVTSQGSSSPCLTPSSTPTLPKLTTKTSKGKTLKTTTVPANNTAAVAAAAKAAPSIPKPQQKPQEDEHTTQRIFDILAEYAEQLRNSPDLNNKPAPRRRSNPPTNPSQNSKRKKSSSGAKKSGQSSSSTLDMDGDDLTVGSEDSSGGNIIQLSVTDDEQSQAATVTTPESNENSSSSSRQLILTESSTIGAQPRNVIIADSSVGEALKMSNAVIVPGNYIMPVSMVKGGQQIAVVSGGSKILATVPARTGQNMLFLQSFTNQSRKGSISAVKYSTIQPISGISSQSLAGVSAQPPVILPSNSVATAVALGQPLTLKKIGEDKETSELVLTISPAKEPPKLVNDHPQPDSSTNISADSSGVKIEDVKLEPIEIDSNLKLDQSLQSENSDEKMIQKYQKTVINSVGTSVIATAIKQEDNTAQNIISLPADSIKVEIKPNERMQSVLVTACSSNGPMLSHTTPRYRKPSESTRLNNEMPVKEEYLHNGGKCNSNDTRTYRGITNFYSNKAKKSGLESQRAESDMQKQAAIERELRLQKSLSEECEDLGVDEPSTSDLFPEADLLFDSNHSPSFDQTSQDMIKRTPQSSEIKEEKSTMNLFTDDETTSSLRTDLFEYVEYQPVEAALNYQERQLINGSNAGTESYEDNTLLPKCATMSEVTLNSPISPDMYQENALSKYKFKYTNRKKNDKIKHCDLVGEIVSSTEDTLCSTEIGKTTCEDDMKILHLKEEKCELHCQDDRDSPSGRGARRSVRKLCSCCNGSQDGNLSRKRPPSSRPQTPAPHKKAFLTKKR